MNTKNTLRLSVSFIAMTILCTCTNAVTAAEKPADNTADVPTQTSADIKELAHSYKTLKQITKEPVFVNPGLARLCRGLENDEIVAAKKAKGPHALTAVHIYMNESAENAFTTKIKNYPIGAIIIKDKAVLGEDGVGGMIKRPAGYNPDNGDWEYFYFKNEKTIESGKIKSCVDCHKAAAAKDYVFGNWALN